MNYKHNIVLYCLLRKTSYFDLACTISSFLYFNSTTRANIKKGKRYELDISDKDHTLHFNYPTLNSHANTVTTSV
jgi:hypothetical protein